MRWGGLRRYATFFRLAFRTADMVVVVVAALVAHRMRFGHFYPGTLDQIAIAIAATATLLVFPMFGVYKAWRGQTLWAEVRAAWVAWLFVVGLGLAAIYVTKTGDLLSRVWVGAWVIVGLFLLAILRLAVRATLRGMRERGFNTRRVVILGAGELGQKVATHLGGASWTGFDVLAFFDDDAALLGSVVDGTTVRGALDDAADFVRLMGADQVWLTLPLAAEDRVRTVLVDLCETAAEIRYVPDIFGFQLLNHSVAEMAGIPVISLAATPMVGERRLLKAVEDRLLALVFLLIGSPLMFLICAGVKFSSPGPVLFKQRRYGLDGKEILVWKFRSMTTCEDGHVIVQAKPNDPRVTSFGRYLRQHSLDELPQLINVLQGTMSIVGPRPHAVAQNEQYRQLLPGYMLRHRVKPGITGLAQVRGWRGQTETLGKMSRRVELDCEYISNWSLWLDLKIIAITLVSGLSGENAY